VLPFLLCVGHGTDIPVHQDGIVNRLTNEVIVCEQLKWELTEKNINVN